MLVYTSRVDTALQEKNRQEKRRSQQTIFQANSDQKYGFDTIVYPAFTEHYQNILVAGEQYQISL